MSKYIIQNFGTFDSNSPINILTTNETYNKNIQQEKYNNKIKLQNKQAEYLNKFFFCGLHRRSHRKTIAPKSTPNIPKKKKGKTKSK